MDWICGRSRCCGAGSKVGRHQVCDQKHHEAADEELERSGNAPSPKKDDGALEGKDADFNGFGAGVLGWGSHFDSASWCLRFLGISVPSLRCRFSTGSVISGKTKNRVLVTMG